MYHEQHEFGGGMEDESSQGLLASEYSRGPFTKLG